MKRLLLVGLAVCGLFVSAAVLSPEMAFAAAKDEICQGVGAVPGGGCAGGTQGLDNVIATGIDIFSRIIGIAAVVMIMYAGFKYVTAGDDSGKVGEAKKTIIYAVIGLVIVAFSQAIVWFVLDRTTETEAERRRREAQSRSTSLPPIPKHYTIEFNNKTVV